MSVFGNVAVVSALRDREPMLLVARDVGWGQRINAQDVTTVDLPSGARLFAVPDTQRPQILGRVATGNLRAGTLLAPTDVTTQSIPAAGQSVVGLRLEPGQFPARGLNPNDAIQVVALEPQSTLAGSSAAPSGVGFAARVVQVSPPDAEGAITADVLIPDTSAEPAARAASSGALVRLLGPRP